MYEGLATFLPDCEQLDTINTFIFDLCSTDSLQIGYTFVFRHTALERVNPQTTEHHRFSPWWGFILNSQIKLIVISIPRINALSPRENSKQITLIRIVEHLCLVFGIQYSFQGPNVFLEINPKFTPYQPETKQRFPIQIYFHKIKMFSCGDKICEYYSK